MIDRAIILPYGEEFNENFAGAAGIFIKESLQHENIKKYMKVRNIHRMSNGQYYRLRGGPCEIQHFKGAPRFRRSLF